MPSREGLRQHIEDAHGIVGDVLDRMVDAMRERGAGGNDYAALGRIHKAMHAAPPDAYPHAEGVKA